MIGTECPRGDGPSWKEQIACGAGAERAQGRQEARVGMTVLGEEDHGLCWVKQTLGNVGWRRGI